MQFGNPEVQRPEDSGQVTPSESLLPPGGALDWFLGRTGVTRSNTFRIAHEDAHSPGALTRCSIQDSDWSQQSL